MPRTNVIITGLGVVSSIGIGAEDFFQSLLGKRSGVCSLAQRTDEGAKPQPGCESDPLWIGSPILDFDPKQHVRPRKALKVMCREIQTAFAASQLAIEDAGLTDLLPAKTGGPIEPSQIGTVFGSEMFYGTPAEMVDAVRGCQDHSGRIDAAQFGAAAMKNIMPLWMLKYLPNMPACHVGISINSQGPNNSLVLGDVSGPAATIEAVSCIQRQIASVMIAGATGTRISTTRINYRSNLPVPVAADPIENSSRPHDPTSHGVVGGEGAAAVVLESSEHADRRGARGLARISAHASCFVPSGGMHNGSLSGKRGSAAAIKTAIQRVLGEGRVAPASIGLVVSHACGDPQTDAAERDAIVQLLPSVPIAAPIAAIGHTGAAAGAMEIATAVLALAHRTIPPTRGAASASPGINFRDQPEPIAGPHALALTHTAEGNAIAILLSSI